MEFEQNYEIKKSWWKFRLSKWERRLVALVKFFSFLIVLTAATIIIVNEFYLGGDYSFTDETTPAGESQVADDCNVNGIELHGSLLTYIPASDYDADGNLLANEVASENIVAIINSSEKDDKVKAILLEVDSYGGTPVAGEEVMTALKNAKKPTVALIREAGDSAAYLAATGANIIFASKYSDVGSIGVTMSYLDYARQNQKAGLTYNQLSSGKFKDTGDPDKILSAIEKQLLMRDINIMHQNFIQAVAENRKLDVQKVAALADGSTMLGEMALKNGLIDRLGGMVEVEQYLKEKIGQKPEICW